MPKLWEKTGDAKNNSDLAEVDQSTLSVTSPTVVFFPGQLTNESRPDIVSKDLNDVKKLFSDMPEPPKVYLWSHPDVVNQNKKRSLSVIFFKAVYNLTLRKLPTPTVNDLSALSRFIAYNLSFQNSATSIAKDQVKKLIMPLVTDAQGKPLPMEEAQKNLRNLTFVGYCIGNLSAQEVFNAAKKQMRKSGFRRKEARKLLREIVLVSFGTFAEPRKEHHRYTTISLIHNDDSMLRAKDQVLHPLRRAFTRFSRRLKIKQLSDTSILVSATNMGKRSDRKKEQPEVIDGVQLPAWRKDAFNHFLTDYVNTNDRGNQFSRIVQYTLLNAVNRHETVKPVDLLKPPATVEKTAVVESYERKIAKAAGVKMAA